MGVIGWIIVGLVAGALAKLVMPGRDPGGIIVTCIIGIVGGLLGGWVSSMAFGIDTGTIWDFRTWLIAFIGAVVLLAIYRLIVGRRSRSRV